MELKEIQTETIKQGEDISCLRADNTWIKSELASSKTERHQLSLDIKEIKEKLLGRPSWFITTLVAIMLGIIGALGMFILNNLI